MYDPRSTCPGPGGLRRNLPADYTQPLFLEGLNHSGNRSRTVLVASCSRVAVYVSLHLANCLVGPKPALRPGRLDSTVAFLMRTGNGLIKIAMLRDKVPGLPVKIKIVCQDLPVDSCSRYVLSHSHRRECRLCQKRRVWKKGATTGTY